MAWLLDGRMFNSSGVQHRTMLWRKNRTTGGLDACMIRVLDDRMITLQLTIDVRLSKPDSAPVRGEGYEPGHFS
jgi:hypothetical protein